MGEYIMIKIVNAAYEDFIKDIVDKELFLYGAGKRAKTLYDYFHLKGKVKAVIDKNTQIHTFEGENEEIAVITLNEFEQSWKTEKSIFLITPTYVYIEIIEELEQNKNFENLRCYVASLIQDYYKTQNFDFTKGMALIPKKIHYCWFGEGAIPDQLKRYMESWQCFCPDYEIIRWDESNYDVTKNQYMKEAYECKKWGYVPDYARLDIIYEQGGIYLDTDVELLASLDKLLNDDMFCQFACLYEVNCGSGFGAIKGYPLIKKMRDYYDGRSFYNCDMTINVTPCMEYQNPVLKEYGFRLDNTYQNINGAVLYPSEVGNPKGRIGAVNNFTHRTLMCHHTSSTHRTDYERRRFVEGMNRLSKMLN